MGIVYWRRLAAEGYPAMSEFTSGEQRGGAGIEARGLWKAYGRTQALRGVDLRVEWGQTLVILGANGCGKTTLVKTLATLVRADAGEAVVGGMNARRNARRVRRLTGVVTHEPLLYDGLTGGENLRFFARMFGVEGIEERVQEVAARMGITGRLDDKAGALSHGLRRRFSIARALLHSPRALIMDEPESGLDQEALGLLEAAIRDCNRAGCAVLMTTHNIERGVALGDRVAILAGGRIAWEDRADAASAAELRGLYRERFGRGGAWE